MIGILTALALSTVINCTDIDNNYNGYEYIGECRITEYCPQCNDGSGHESSSGVYLEYGHAACNWLPIGTIVNIEGDEFVVVDTCGTDAIDIFVDTDECHCNLNEYKRVAIKKVK